MKKQKILRVINPLMLLLVLSQVTAVLFHKVLPQGSFLYMHVIPGFTLVILYITHLVLNWGWIKNSYCSKKEIK